MNLFKTTLLGVMIAGIACANISANNDTQNGLQESHQIGEQGQILELDESILSHTAKAFGWMGLSGVSGALSYHQFIGSLYFTGATLESLKVLVSTVNANIDTCPAMLVFATVQAAPVLFSTEVAQAALTVMGTTALTASVIWSMYFYGKYGMDALGNAINHMKAMVNN